MSRKDKRLQRFLSRPTDFTWNELVSLLKSFGFTEITGGKTGGSRRRFTHTNGTVIFLHKPHPGNVLKRYQMDQLIAFLKQENLL